MKVIKNNIIPFGSYKAINLFGVVFTKGELSQVDLNHEMIHTKQMKEMLYIFYYIWYIIEYIIVSILNIIKTQNERYHEISFEEEAYNNESNLSYLETRKAFSWVKYLSPYSNE